MKEATESLRLHVKRSHKSDSQFSANSPDATPKEAWTSLPCLTIPNSEKKLHTSYTRDTKKSSVQSDTVQVSSSVTAALSICGTQVGRE